MPDLVRARTNLTCSVTVVPAHELSSVAFYVDLIEFSLGDGEDGFELKDILNLAVIYDPGNQVYVFSESAKLTLINSLERLGFRPLKIDRCIKFVEIHVNMVINL